MKQLSVGLLRLKGRRVMVEVMDYILIHTKRRRYPRPSDTFLKQKGKSIFNFEYESLFLREKKMFWV